MRQNSLVDNALEEKSWVLIYKSLLLASQKDDCCSPRQHRFVTGMITDGGPNGCLHSRRFGIVCALSEQHRLSARAGGAPRLSKPTIPCAVCHEQRSYTAPMIPVRRWSKIDNGGSVYGPQAEIDRALIGRLGLASTTSPRSRVSCMSRQYGG